MLERYNPEFFEGVRKRVLLLTILLFLVFMVLAARLWYLQVMKGQYFKMLSQNNRVRTISLPAYRGNIYDRNGEVLVNIRPSFNVYIVPEDSKNIKKVLSFLKTTLDIDIDRIKKDIKSSMPFSHVLVKRSIRRDKVAFIEEHSMDLPGVILQVEPLRSYKNKNLASHVLGYISEINRSELEKLKDSDYKLGDFIGKYGLEKVYENILQGKKGSKRIEVDSAGRELNVLKIKNPEPGQSLILTIDSALQRIAERLLSKTKLTGSVVAIKPDTGEVLVMASKPSFDPNMFSDGISSKNWSSLINDKRHPIQNRAISGQFPPGSTYKIVTAAAGLEKGIIDKNATFFCPGFFKFGKRAYRCWKKGGHGKVNVVDALIKSCDVFFYKLGMRLGIDTIAQYAKTFGLGKVTGINIRGEKPGLIPSKIWKEKVKKTIWLPGETISASIGQGYNLTTPLQLASLIGAVANNGKVYTPFLVKRIEGIDGQKILETKPELKNTLSIKQENLNIIQQALFGVVNKRGGTAWRAKLKSVAIAGKTGTSQVVRLKPDDEEEENEDEEIIPIQFRDHALFVSYAPFEDPEIAVSVIVEHGGHGGATAAPIARDIIKAYMKKYGKKKGT